MRLDPGCIRDLHAEFGTPSQIVERRRALYSAVLELTSTADPSVSDQDPDLLDSPVVRGHLGDVLSGQVEVVDRGRFARLSDVGTAVGSGTTPLVASQSIVPDVLADAIRLVGGGTEADAGRFVTGESPAFGTVSEMVGAGTRLLRTISPDLADDLLPHVDLVAIVDHAQRFGSASFRELPGLVLVPRPASEFEIAEALVHEGAHQKFFDLSVTCAMLRPSAYSAEGYRASWSTGRTPWPVEQCLAAFHAYRCLAAFEYDRAGAGIARHPFSLLPRAAERADELGAWLDRSRHLGIDGRRFVDLFSGRMPVRGSGEEDLHLESGRAAVTRDCGDRTLLAFPGSPIRLVWQPVGRS